MITLKFLSQTREAISNLSFIEKIMTYALCSVLIIYLIPNLDYRTPLMLTFAVVFSGAGLMMTIAIMLLTAFHKENKEELDIYMLENYASKISSQTLARVIHSERAYEDLRETLPHHLKDNIGLYVGSKWGRISKYTILSLVAFFFLVRIITGEYLGG